MACRVLKTGRGSHWLRMFLILAAVGMTGVADGNGKSHGFAMRAELKYKPGFKNFEYANPTAPKGGALTVASFGTFDTMNPFVPKGTPALVIGYGSMFESLTTPSLDEPFAQYGLLADSMELATDELSVSFHMNPKAKFSDGKPVTAADVEFSFNLLMSDKAAPFYKAYYADVKSVKALDKANVRFDFRRKNPELHLIVGQMAILPKHFYGTGDFSKDFSGKVLGSGPYVLREFEFGKFSKAARNPDYWGKDLPVNAGKYNFDQLMIKYYLNGEVMFEAFKAGEFDYMYVNSAKMWAVDAKGEKFDKNHIVKRLLKHGQTQGIQGFALNVRRPMFQDRNVRHALALALDFEWMNSTLFYNQYQPYESFFDNSPLQAKGLPTGAELKLLEPLRAQIPAEVFTKPMAAIGKGLDARGRILEAKRLLEAAGYSVKDNVLVDKQGKKLSFTILLIDPSFQRIVEPYLGALRKLGIDANMKVEDKSIFVNKVRKFDFDVIVNTFGQSESPGNEQRDKWHSSSANVDDSDNIVGIQNPAVDKLVDAVITAKSRSDLETATHALDRVLWHEHYVVPQWSINAFRTLWWNKFALPTKVPPYMGSTPNGYFIHYAWLDPAREAALKAAIKDGKLLPKSE